jgi:hypothetical protein
MTILRTLAELVGHTAPVDPHTGREVYPTWVLAVFGVATVLAVFGVLAGT